MMNVRFARSTIRTGVKRANFRPTRKRSVAPVNVHFKSNGFSLFLYARICLPQDIDTSCKALNYTETAGGHFDLTRKNLEKFAQLRNETLRRVQRPVLHIHSSLP